MPKEEVEAPLTAEEELDQVLTSIEQHIAEQQKHIDLNADLERLKKNKAFKNIVQNVFIKNGKDYLWDNIRDHKELDLVEKGSVREGNIEKFETELQARLILERFFERIKEDAEHAAESIKEAEDYRYKLLNPDAEVEAEGEADA